MGYGCGEMKMAKFGGKFMGEKRWESFLRRKGEMAEVDKTGKELSFLLIGNIVVAGGDIPGYLKDLSTFPNFDLSQVRLTTPNSN